MFSALAGDASVLAAHLVAVAGEAVAAAGRPMWVVLGRPHGEVPEVSICAEGFDPLGWCAPHDCAALAMVASGRVRSLDESVELEAGLASGRGGGVRLGCVVVRDGSIGWHMVLPDGSTYGRPPQDGRALDIMRRCLELPTPAPAVPARVLSDCTWLATILDGPLPGRRLTWSEVLDRHPALSGMHPEMDPAAKEALINWTVAGAGWGQVRQAVAAGYGDEGFPPAELAGWMDDGMFSRWVVEDLVPVEELLDLARPRLQPVAARRLAHCLRRW